MSQNNKQFALIQTGNFTSTPTANPFKIKNLMLNIEFNYMYSNLYNVISRRYGIVRIMHNRHRYSITKTGIHLKDGNELLLYCDRENALTIISMIKEYISNPYDLIGSAAIHLTSDGFWWCMDKSPMFGDWFAFTSNNTEVFKRSMDEADAVWMMIPNYEREAAYRKAVV